jgi:hypothetical protein
MIHAYMQAKFHAWEVYESEFTNFQGLIKAGNTAEQKFLH